MKIKYPLFAILLVAILLAAAWFSDGLILGSSESAIPFYNLDRYFNITKSSWMYPALGNATGIFIASFPTYQVLSAVQNLGIQGFVVEAIFFIFLFFVGGYGTYLLTKLFFPKLPPSYLLLASLFYIFNPFTLVNVWNRFLYNHMVFWAVIPLALYLYVKGLEKKDYMYALLFSLSLVIFSYAFTSTAFLMVLWFLVIYSTAFYMFFMNKKKSSTIKYFLTALITFLLFNLWWIGQLFNFLGSSNFDATVSKFFTSEGNLSTLTVLSSRLGNISYISRLMHKDFFSELPEWKFYVSLPAVIIEFLVAGIVFLTIIVKRKSRGVLFWGILFILGIFLAKGSAEPMGIFFNSAFKQIFPIQVFRNPFEKLGFILVLPASILFSAGIYYLFRKRKVQKYILLAGYLYVLVFWGLPFWSGSVLKLPSNLGTTQINYKVTVPEYYDQVNKWLTLQEGDFRVLVLPLGGEGITHIWEEGYSGVELTSTLFDTPALSYTTSVPYFFELMMGVTENQMDQAVFNYLPYTNVKYILIRDDIDFKERKMPNPESTKIILEEWVAGGLVKQVYNAGNLSVYEVNDKYVWPRFYVASGYLETNSTDLARSVKKIPNFPEKKTIVINNVSNNDGNSKRVIFPLQAAVQEQLDTAKEKLNDEELVSGLFQVNYLPDDTVYPLIRFKEFVQENTQPDYNRYLSFKIGLLGKRAVEIYKLRKDPDSSEELINKAEKLYLRLLKDKEIDVVGPTRDYIVDSILSQWVLLARSGSSVSEELLQLLIQWEVRPIHELPELGLEYVVYKFNVDRGDKYQLSGDAIEKSRVLFLDGQQISSVLIQLDPGEYEFGVGLAGDDLFESRFIDNGFKLTDSYKKWPLRLSGSPQHFIVDIEYRFIKGNTFNLEFTQDIDSDSSSLFSKSISKDFDYHGWKNISEKIITSPGAITGELALVPTKAKVCHNYLVVLKKCELKDKKFEVEIKEIRLREVDIPEVFLTSGEYIVSQSQTSIKTSKLETTKYKLNVLKLDEGSEFLVFSELFDSGWTAYYGDTKIPLKDHTLVNTYANGWVMDRKGDYDVIIEYLPERRFKINKRISTIAIVAGMLIVLVIVLRQKQDLKRKKAKDD